MLCVALSLDGTRVVSGSADKKIYIWDAETGTIVTGPFESHNGTAVIICCILLSDDKRIFSVSPSCPAGMIHIWNIETGSSVSWEYIWVRLVAFSVDGKHAVFGSFDNDIRIADADTGTIISGPFRGTQM